MILFDTESHRIRCRLINIVDAKVRDIMPKPFSKLKIVVQNNLVPDRLPLICKRNVIYCIFSTIFLTPSSLFALGARCDTSRVVRIAINDRKGVTYAERQVQLRSLPPGVGDRRCAYVTSLFAFNCCISNDDLQGYSITPVRTAYSF